MLHPSKHLYQPTLLLTPLVGKELASFTSSHMDSFQFANEVLIRVLTIPRISDDSYFTLKVKILGKKVVFDAQSVRLKVLILLLKALEENKTGVSVTVPTQFPSIQKCHQIELYFKTPKMNVSEVIVKNAIWAPPDKTTQEKSIMISGDARDYVADLEELILVEVFGDSESTIIRSKNVSRALKLLSDLDSEKHFLQHLYRDFGALFEFKNPENLVDVSEIEAALFKSVKDIDSSIIGSKRERSSDEIYADADDAEALSLIHI